MLTNTFNLQFIIHYVGTLLTNTTNTLPLRHISRRAGPRPAYYDMSGLAININVGRVKISKIHIFILKLYIYALIIDNSLLKLSIVPSSNKFLPSQRMNGYKVNCILTCLDESSDNVRTRHECTYKMYKNDLSFSVQQTTFLILLRIQ